MLRGKAQEEVLVRQTLHRPLVSPESFAVGRKISSSESMEGKEQSLRHEVENFEQEKLALKALIEREANKIDEIAEENYSEEVIEAVLRTLQLFFVADDPARILGRVGSDRMNTKAQSSHRRVGGRGRSGNRRLELPGDRTRRCTPQGIRSHTPNCIRDIVRDVKHASCAIITHTDRAPTGMVVFQETGK